MNPAGVHATAGNGQLGLGTLFIPLVGKAYPSLWLINEEPGLYQSLPFFRITNIVKITKGFYQHRADRKVEGLRRIELRRRTIGHPDEAVLVGIVRVEGCV